MKEMKKCLILIAVCATLWSLGGSAVSWGADAQPATFDPPAGHELAFTLRASGVQIYECKAKKDNSAQFEWVFKAPEADLFDPDGKKVGSHFKGPTWKANDGSSVVGEKPKSYVKDTNAIPWLLLDVKQHEGTGIFSKVTSIQRVDTVGGKAPAGGCDAASVGKEIRVPYTANYRFYVTHKS